MKDLFKKAIAWLIVIQMILQPIAPALAASESIYATDLKNSLETVGTKANRLKTIGASGVDESSGAFTYSYPFGVPKGKFGLEPTISINYNSQSTDNNIVGYGMTLAIPYIERVAKHGVDKIYSEKYFVSSLGGELIAKPNSAYEYVQKYDDGSYQLYTFNESQNLWTLTDRSGNIYTYGQTLDSRLYDVNIPTHTARYYLNSVKDLLGNQIKYYYYKSNNFVYPQEIVYTVDKLGSSSNRVVFEREARSDEEVGYRNAFRVTMSERVKSIKAYTDNTLVAQLDLAYTAGQNGARSLLSSLTEGRLGTDNVWTTLPATRFDYTQGQDVSASLEWKTTNGKQLWMDTNGDGRPEQTQTADGEIIVDADGDYFPDRFIRALDFGCSSGRGWYDNGNSGFFKNVNGTSVKYSWQVLSLPVTYSASAVSNGNGQYNCNQSFAMVPVAMSSDFNGDGLQDVRADNPYYSGTETFLNNVAGDFIKTDNYSRAGSTHLEADFNDDGLTDLADQGGIYLNNGLGWNTSTESNITIPSTTVIGGADCRSAIDIGIIETTFDGGTRFVDVNNDGLVDMIRAYRSTGADWWRIYYGGDSYSNYYWKPTANADIYELYINTGRTFRKVNNPNFGGNYIVDYNFNHCSAINGNPVWKTPVIIANNPVVPDILQTITGPMGGKTEVAYQSTASMERPDGTLLNPKLPVNLKAVKQIKETETVNNITETTDYTFENGKMYYDANNITDRRYAGFGKVTIQKGSQKTIKYFHQGDGDDAALSERGDSINLIGKVFKEELYGGAVKLGETYSTDGVYEYGGQIFQYPKSEITTQYDATGTSLSKAVTYEYDLAARLPKKIINWGEVNYNIATNAITDLGDDLISSVMISTTRRPQKFLSEEKTDVNGNFVDKVVNLYDNLPFGYVEKGLLTETRNYRDAVNYTKTTHAYNALGLPERVVDNNGHASVTLYDGANNPISVTNALGQATQTTYNKTWGLLTAQIDPNGNIQEFNYDGFGNVLTKRATSPKTGTTELVSATTYTYGNGLTVQDQIYKDGAAVKTIINKFDSFGRNIENSESLEAGVSKTTRTIYNNLGQISSVIYPFDSAGILAGYNPALDTQFFYDDIGRLIKSKQGDSEVSVIYYVNGKKVYDNSPQQHAKIFRYNTAGKITAVTEIAGGHNYLTQYSWNILGNLTKLTDAQGNVRNFTYDSEGRLTKQEDLHKVDDNTFGVYRYVYDVIGNLLSKTDPAQTVYNYSYDELYRPMSESNGEITTNYTYDNCANGVGKLCAVANSDYVQTMAYTKSGHTQSETKIIDDQTFINSYLYNSLGQMEIATLPDESRLLYIYGQNGQQTSVHVQRVVDGQTVTTNIVNDATYNVDGTPKEVSLSNNTKTCYAYSNANGGQTAPRLSDIYVLGNGGDCAAASAGSALYHQNLSYNLFGSITGMTEKYAGDTGDIVSSFTYDELERLTNTQRLEDGQTVNGAYAYSPIGNLLSANEKNYVYSGSDYQNPHAAALIGTTQMAYDLNGNVLGDGANTYAWTKRNTLKSVHAANSASSYTYDVAGERIKEVTRLKNVFSLPSTSTPTSSLTFPAQDSNGGATTYISESGYDELAAAQLNSQNKFDLLFTLAAQSPYTTAVCGAYPGAECAQISGIKFVAGFLASKYGIQLSAATLEEAYRSYQNLLILPTTKSGYERDAATGAYKYPVNDITLMGLAVSTTTLQTEVYNHGDAALYSYITAEPTIASLFPNPKLISSDTLAELSTAELTYTNLVIYDRLIGYAFAPYGECSARTTTVDKNLCEKEIFIKYLFALVNYDSGKQLSTYALDEIYEAMQGNLTVPNNSGEYTTREIKSYSLSDPAPNTDMIYSYYPGIGNKCATNYDNKCCSNDCAPARPTCVFANSHTRTTDHQYVCDFYLRFPAELMDRKQQIESAKVNFMVNPSSYQSYDGGGFLEPYASPYLTLVVTPVPKFADAFNQGSGQHYPVINQTAYPDLITDVVRAKYDRDTEVDVSKMVKYFSGNNQTQTNVAFSSGGYASSVDFSHSNLTVKYAWPADAISRASYTPLVTDPRDSAVENNVLTVLARVDRDHPIAPNTIISQATYNEIKTTAYTTNDAVVNLFNQNEKLQKDETLAAVWNQVHNQFLVSLTREALEELFMVWRGQLSMPESGDWYDAVESGSLTYNQNSGGNFSLFTVTNDTGDIILNNCNPSGQYCVAKLIDFPSSPEILTTNAIITATCGNENGGQNFTGPFRFDALSEVSTTTNKLVSIAANGEYVNQDVQLGWWNASYSAYVVQSNITSLFVNSHNRDLSVAGIKISAPGSLHDFGVSLNISYIKRHIGFDRSTLTNLSVVPGVPSARDLYPDDEAATSTPSGMALAPIDSATIPAESMVAPETISTTTETISAAPTEDTGTSTATTTDTTPISTPSSTPAPDSIPAAPSEATSTPEENFTSTTAYLPNAKFTIAALKSISVPPVPTAPAPMFSLRSGSTYNNSTTLQIFDSLTGAAIYYTLNGTAPTINSARYTAPLILDLSSNTITVKALAAKAGYYNSAIASAIYYFQTATPTMSVAGGKYFAPQTIVLSSVSTNAYIYYTLNGATPAMNSPLYTGPIRLNTDGVYTLKAVAYKKGYALSGVSSQTYDIKIPPPAPIINTFITNTSTIITGQSARLYWSLGGGTPTVLSINNGVGSVMGTTTKLVSPTTNTTYILTASNISGTVTKQVTITVNPPAPVINSFTVCPAPNGCSGAGANTTTIIFGQSARLFWSLSGGVPTTLSINGVGSVMGTSSLSVTPATNTIYTLTATNITGTATKQVSIVVNPPAPIINTFTTNTSTIVLGQSARLSWSLSGGAPTTLSINNGIGSVMGTTSVSVAPTTNTTYILTASNISGTVTKQITITVNPPAPTINTFTANTTTVFSGQSLAFSWTTGGGAPTSLNLNNGVGGNTNVLGQSSINLTAPTVAGPNAQTSTYTLTAANITGTSTRQLSITVKPPVPAVATFTVSSSTIILGQSITLSWTLSGGTASAVSISSGVGNVTGLSSITISPTTSTTYIISATNVSGSGTKQLAITVNPPLPVIDSFTANPAVVIDGRTTTFAWALSGGAATSVYIDNNVGPVNGLNSKTSSALYNTATFTLYAVNISGTVSKSIMVKVNPPAPIINSFSANTNTVISGTTTTLSWSLAGGTPALVSIDHGVGLVTGSSSVAVVPVIQSGSEGSYTSSTVIYTLTASNDGGMITSTVAITVTPSFIPEETYTKYYPSPYYEYETAHGLAGVSSTPANGGMIAINVPFNGKIVATLKYPVDHPDQVQISYLHLNYLGTPVILTNESGEVIQTIKRDAWGEIVSNINTTNPTEFGFTGHRYDTDSALTYAHARYYSGANKVFLSQDPEFWVLNQDMLNNPQSLNSYSYSLNNPVNYTDPTGRTSIKNFFKTIYNKAKSFFAPTRSQPSTPVNNTPPTQTQTVTPQTATPQPTLPAVPQPKTTTWDSGTDKRIKGLDPRVQQPATNFINRTESELDIKIRVYQGYRSTEEQNKLYMSSRTNPPGPWRTDAKGGQSYHNYGLAIDVVRVEDGVDRWVEISPDIAEIGKQEGFVWGGDWVKRKDYGHFEMTFGKNWSELLEESKK